jgi:hypothetical protein
MILIVNLIGHHPDTNGFEKGGDNNDGSQG